MVAFQKVEPAEDPEGAGDDLAVNIRWPRTQDEPMAAAKPVDQGVARAPAEDVDGARRAGRATDRRIDALAAQLELLVEAQVAQARSLERLAAEQVELTERLRQALTGVVEQLGALRRRIGVRGRAAVGIDGVAVEAIADAIAARLGLSASPGAVLHQRAGSSDAADQAGGTAGRTARRRRPGAGMDGVARDAIAEAISVQLEPPTPQEP